MSHSFKLMLVLVGVVVADPDFLHAQIPVRIGVEAGMSLANQSFSYGDYVWMETYRFGFVVGGLVEIGLSNVMYVQIEPRLIQKGMRTPVTLGKFFELSDEADFQLDYAEFPVLLKARFGTSNFKPFLCAGPSIGVLLSATYRTEQYDSGILRTRKGIDIRGDYKSIDYAVILGGGGEYQLSRNVSLIGSARYSFGLYNISTRSSGDVTSNGIEVLFGSLFGL